MKLFVIVKTAGIERMSEVNGRHRGLTCSRTNIKSRINGLALLRRRYHEIKTEKGKTFDLFRNSCYAVASLKSVAGMTPIRHTIFQTHSRV